MKRLFFAIAIILIGLTAFTADPPGTKVPIGLVVGAGKTKTVIDSTELKRIKEIDNKVSLDSLQSATDQFYTKTQSNARFINEDGDTITGTILVPTPEVGTNNTQVVNAAFVNQTAVRKIYSSNVQHSNTGDTNENTILTFTIPGGSIGANGSFHIITMASFTSSTNLKKFTVKFNGVAVAYFSTASASVSYRGYNTIYNRNSLSSQILGPATVPGGGAFGGLGSTTALATTSINTASDITVTVTAQLATGTETISLEAIEILSVY